MKDFKDMKHYPMLEDITQVLTNKTQSNNPLFYQVLTAYYLGKISGMMNPMIKTLDRGTIPINIYAINLAPSGFSKGYSTNIIENEVIGKFKKTFMSKTFPIVGEASLANIAIERADSKGTDPDDERKEVNKEFMKAGSLLFSFSEGTAPAVKQMRRKILMANCGAVNLEMDEMGSNLIANSEVLNAFLELYDVGKIKEKLIKNTTDNVRATDMEGITPTNMMLFGTPDKLLDGSRTEDEFYSFLSTGYARRCLFGYIKATSNSMLELTAKQILERRMDKSNDALFQGISDKLAKLAEPQHHGKTIYVQEDVSLELIEYEMNCAERVELLPVREDIRRAEMTHRYFKALKLAGAYAFVDESSEITLDHLHAAIKLVEESGLALQDILKRDKAHVKLAKYLADQDTDVTLADLLEDLPTFKGTAANKNEQVTLATAWGYKNNIVIKNSFVDGVQFFSADSLKDTDLDNLIISVSNDVAYGYENHYVKWEDLGQEMQADGMHWCSHHFTNGHRNDTNIVQGTNMIVLDVDGGISFDTAKALLKGYKCLIYKTKRDTDENNRFRIIFPTNYKINLDSMDYKEFMRNIYSFLPFDVDDATCDRPRKWMTNNKEFEYLDGELLDILPFIPKTTKAEEFAKRSLDTQSMDNIERWFVQQTGAGNRSNQLIKYALLLVDSGTDLIDVQHKVMELNNKLKDKLNESEISTTIMRTVRNRINRV